MPTETVLSHHRNPYLVDLDEYKEDLLNNMATAWKLASENTKRAQVCQKKSYDKKSQEVDLKVGEQIMVFMPSDCQGKERKLTRPFHGPYHVVAVTSNTAKVRLVDRPNGESICVLLDRVRRCYQEEGNMLWTGPRSSRKKKSKK